MFWGKGELVLPKKNKNKTSNDLRSMGEKIFHE